MAKIYRKIYKEHHGPIPRGYDIHHIDGDNTNNHISNLIAVSRQQHYDIHYSQGDYTACQMIAKRMEFSIEELSRLSSELNYARVAEGTHPWLGPDNNQKRIEDGTHHLLGPDHALKRVAEGTHPSQIMASCIHCRKEVDIPNLNRHHGDKCRSLNPTNNTFKKKACPKCSKLFGINILHRHMPSCIY